VTKKGKNFYELLLYDDKLVFTHYHFNIIIRYTNYDIKKLLSLPGLDFFKSCYDGNKIHYTNEAVQYHKTKKVQYTGVVHILPSSVITNMFSKHLNYKDEFWKSNEHLFKLEDYEVNINYDLYTINYNNRKSIFPDKFNSVIKKKLLASRLLFRIDSSDIDE
jgi:hypothetical protein